MSEKVPNEAVSLAEVAERAGVSSATASKALNGRADVNEATRSRVEEAARELGYLPNYIARGLMGAKTGTVGVVTTDLEGRFALPILMGVEDALGTERILSFLCDARGDDERERQLIRSLLARRVDGIIMVGRQTDERPSVGELPVPVVYAYAHSSDPADLSIVPDNVQVGRIAAEHLLGLGRRRIAHVSGEAAHGASRDRLVGIQEAMSSAGVDLVGPPLFGDWSEGWGRAAAGMLIEGGAPIDGIVCGSDQIARGVLESLHDQGIEVPRDVAVIGVDNWVTLAENARPALTTVDIQLKRLGRIAAIRLQAATAGEPAGGIERVAGEVVIRDSTIPRR